ncbi:hypothetical protein DOTSEDRAFT_180554 [Dothistroma septosporum NZE10]|uniref:C3H1-type domain-containing protein n=1 Tax=Dothistroma septosporum (strain NZE10 / CBS 128990) TaxID=675120 RepID=M2YIH0_DOTSN|nr:hypothetical protein DOTSEDRAFT_180554 [Dothistroma septosporum NZE10]
MPSEKELDQAAADLQRFRLSQEQHAKSQGDILQQYQTLIRDYQRLQADYDEARDSRDNYKRLSKGADRDPFVLVLVDGDGYVFNDDLISGGIEGGSKAAQQLENAMKRSLMVKGLEDCRILVRVYANLSGLSRAGSKEKLCGAEKRSLGAFAASFNRSNDLFDFVDAGEQKDSVSLKLRAQFRQFVDNAQCRHIFFAGCHDIGYMSDLTKHANKHDRITLLRNHAFQEEFHQLGLPDEQLLPNVFRRSPLVDQGFVKPAKAIDPAATHNEDMKSVSDEAPVCFHFQKGRCAYGLSCKKRHIRAPIDDIKDWRQKPTTPEFDARFPARRNDSYGSNGDALQQSALTRIEDLPRLVDIPGDKIALNADGRRLDPYMYTTPGERASFTAWTKERKLCNDFHLTHNCPHPMSCKYDHSPIDESLRNCLRQAAFSIPCKRRDGTCRDLGCNYGHVCQRSECKFRGGKWYCRFPAEAHTVDFEASEYVDGIGQENGNASYSTRSHSTAPDASSEHESQHTSGRAETILEPEAEVVDLIDVLTDTVPAGPAQEAMWEAEPDARPEIQPVPKRKSKWQPEPESEVAPTWDGRW